MKIVAKETGDGGCGRRHGIEECVSCGMPNDIKQSDVDYLFWRIPLPLYVTDREGNFLGFNEEFLELFGYTREEIINVKAPDLYVNTEDRNGLLETLVKQGEIKDYEVRLRKRNGDEMLCKIGCVLRRGEGEEFSYYGFIRDITDRRQLHEAAEKTAALEASVRTAVGMAHDFNNILTAILGNVELVKGLSTAITIAVGEHKELETILGNNLANLTAKLEVIHGAAERAQELVQRLNGYTITDKPEILDVNKIATDVVNTMGPLAAKSGYHLNYELKTDRLVSAHSIQIYRIISNLVQNAGEAIANASAPVSSSILTSLTASPISAVPAVSPTPLTPVTPITSTAPAAPATPTNFINTTDGNITIVTQNVDIPTIFGSHGEILEGSYVLLSVSDNGPGIQPEAMEKIFEPYFTTKQTGTGLGLFNVWKIVSDYHGHINVLTRTEPKGDRRTGTTFQIYLPVAEAVKPAESSLTERIQKGLTDGELTQHGTLQQQKIYSNLNILVVDNESAITELLEVYLKASGHNPTIVTSAEEALRLYESSSYDLVISDVNMPGMSGFDLCKRIIARKSDARFCLMSGFFEAENVSAFNKLGVIGYLKKPFSPKNVEELISSAMCHVFTKKDIPTYTI